MRHPVIILHHARIRTHGYASWRRSIGALALRSTAIWLLWIIHHVLWLLLLAMMLDLVLKRLLVLVLLLLLMLVLVLERLLVGSLRCRCRLWSRCNVRNVSGRGMLGLLGMLRLLG
jgi:hypothetical protein